MSDDQNKQPTKGWGRSSASPMRNVVGFNRLMSPTSNPNVARQKSPTPTFDARQLSPVPTVFNPTQQSPTPPLRRLPPQSSGFTTVYESRDAPPSRPPAPQQTQKPQTPQQFRSPMSPVNLPHEITHPRPFRSTFSPTPSASTPCSIPPFSPPPTSTYVQMDRERHMGDKPMTDFYVVPLEPSSQQKGISIYDQDEARPSTADIIAQQSQDYIDEKLAEYQATISLLQDEQERVQKKTFVNWINSYLAKRNPPLRIEDLFYDLRDGTKLIALLEILSGERLPMEKSRNMKRPHFLSNANTALQFLASKRIKLVNINSADLVDGKPAVVLGLIWTIILYFQIEENSRILNIMSPDSISMETVPSASRQAALDASREGPKKSLLSWVSKAIPSNLGIEVKDFGPSWRDGYAFMGLINAIDENLIDIEQYRNASNKHRLDTSFNVAETELGIPKLLDPIDVDMPKPDERSVMTYVAQFLHKYPEPKSLQSGTSEGSLQRIQTILQWMREQIIKYDSMNGSFPLDVDMYMQALAENNQKYNSVEKIKLTGNVSDGSLIEYNDAKNRLNVLMDEWKKYIDYNLPGELKTIGVWIHQAEKILLDNEVPQAMNEDTAAFISKKIEHHKKFFASYPEVLEKFNSLKASHQYQNIPPKIFEFVERRLLEIEPKARQRRIKLKFMEHKCCLIAFLNLLENKISSVHYGNEDNVKNSLDQIRSFLKRNKIVEEFEKALVDMRQVIEEYKIDGNLSRKDLFEIDTFMGETENRWKSVSTGLKCTETMLEETLNHWKRYNGTSRNLSSWMDAAENAVNFPEMERLEFFKDIALVKKNYDSVHDVYNFLKATCEKETVRHLDQDYNTLCARWDRIYQFAKQYTHAGDILKNRQMYEKGIQNLCSWLRHAEGVLNRQNINTADQIREHQENLKKISSELEGMEDTFRSISKSFQTLIPDISRDEVDRIMKILKKEKESLVCVRAQVPLKMQLFHQLLSQQESIEKGQQEISKWLDEAENLLSTYSLATRKSQTLSQLEKHKYFFSKTLYYKSMLESKNIVLQNLLRAADVDKNIDTVAAETKMTEINERFNYVVSNAVQWERKLHEIINCWNNFEMSEKQLAEYLKKANHWLTQPLTDNREDLDAQMNFFENINEKHVKHFIDAANELSQYLPSVGKQDVIEIVDKLQLKWNNLITIVPLHLMKIHFFTENIKFSYLVRDIEKELNYEEQAFHRNENLDELLAQHLQFFQQSQVLRTAELSLSNMHNILTQYNSELPNDKELNNTYQNKSIMWQNLCKRVDIIFNDLQQIPDQWKNYRNKFAQIQKWMDNVEISLSQLTRELSSFEEFEHEKLVFQSICTEADSKREDMKWLLKTLDFLVSHAPDDVVHSEQKKLEELVARYKVLIPTIEITMIKTEVFSKCYTYRQEVSTIVALLEKISTQAASQTEQQPENINSVKQMIKAQEQAVNQLDSQRGHIMTMLQRGKDLCKDIHAPAFITHEVKSLESGWNQTYSSTQEKLQTLKTVENVWQQFDSQKREIMSLVHLADVELRSVTPLQTDPTNCITDMQNKQQLQAHLQKSAVPIFSKLEQLYEALLSEVSVKEENFIREIDELHRRFDNTLDQLKERVEYLENYNSRWNDYKKRLADLHAWATQIAPQVIESLTTSDLPPEERKQRLEKLEVEFHEKMRTFELLSSDAFDLAPKEGNIIEAKKLKNEVRNLHATMNAINTAIQNNAQVINQDLSHWEQYQTQINEIKHWVEEAPKPLTIEDYQPTVLNDAKEFYSEIELYKQQCQKKVAKLDEIANIGEEIQLNEFLPNDIDFYQAKWKKVQDNANNLAGKMGTIVKNWQNFNDQVIQLEEWINESGNYLNEFEIELARSGMDELEKHLNTMKFFENEISEKQSNLISLNQLSERFCGQLTAEGSSGLKEKLKLIKEQLENIAKKANQQIKGVGMKINANQEINTKLNNFNSWMENLRKSAFDVDDVSVRNIESSLQIIHSLLEQHGECEAAFSEIYMEIKKLSAAATPSEAAILNETYSSLAASYQNLNENLYAKKEYLEKWVEFLHCVNDVREFIKHHGKQVSDSALLKPSDIELMLSNISDYLKTTPQWQATAEKLDANPIIRVKNDYDKVEHAIPMVQNLETELENLKGRCDAKLSKNKLIDEKKGIFKNLEKEIIKNLNGFDTDVKNIHQMVDSKEINFDEALGKFQDLKNNLAKCHGLLSQIHQEGNSLIKDDFNDMINVQEIILVLDKEFNNLNDNCDESIQNYTLLSKATNDHKKLVEKARNEIKNIPMVNEQDILNNQVVKPIIDANLDTFKRQLEHLRKIKIQIDDIDRKGNEILKFCENIRRQAPKIQDQIQELKNLWNDANEKVSSHAILFDSVASLWQQVYETAGEISDWLDNIDEIITESTENKKEVESGFMRLNKYKIELPSYTSLKNEMEAKAEEIKKIHNLNLEPQQLQDIVQNINERFVVVDERVKNLENIATNFTQEEKNFKLKLKAINESINKIRDKIIDCDDTTGEIAKNVSNLNRCYEIDNSLEGNKKELAALSANLNQLFDKFPNVKESALPKELENIIKRQDVLVRNNDKNKRNLSNYIEKTMKDKINGCSKAVQQQIEKVQWCKPEAASDKYNLEVKLNALGDVEKLTSECREKLQNIETSLNTIKSIPQLKVNDLVEMKEQVNKSHDHLVTEYTDVKNDLEENIKLWNKYEALSDAFLNNIKDLESKIKSETAYQINLFTVDDKLQNIQERKKEIDALKPQLEELILLGNAITEKNVDAHINQAVNQTAARYNTVSNLINTILDRLNDYKNKYAAYNDANTKFTSWLTETKAQTENLQKLGDGAASKVQLNDLKMFLNQIVTRFDELKALNEKGETLYTGVTLDSREAIRKNLKQLRNTYETMHKKLNALIKKLDSDISQKASIEENHEQIKQWLAELSPKVHASELYATLPEKKAALHANKTTIQDVTLHKGILQQLEAKVSGLSDKDSLQRIKATAKEYDNMIETIDTRIATCEDHIANHELLDSLIEGFRDELLGLKNNWDDAITESVEPKSISENIQFTQNILDKKKTFDDKLEQCYQQLNVVMNQTKEKGHPELFNAFKEQKDDWLKFITTCEMNRNKYEVMKNQCDKFNDSFNDLQKFLKEKETILKDQTLKSNYETKMDHSNLLKNLLQEIKSKASSVSKLHDELRELPSDNDNNVKLSQINTRFQTLENSCKDAINRYEIYCNEHLLFNDIYDEFKKEMQVNMDNLKLNSEITGNLDGFQEIRRQVKELQEKQNNDNVTFEQLIAQGENLYPHTNPDGREHLRQQLKALKNEWDNYSEDLVALGQKVDHCVQQFAEFSESQEQLSNWLREVEKSIQSHTELRSTLQEKNLQLQNHMLMHQEILSQTNLVDGVCEKAQQLIDETKDANVEKYLDSIKVLFKNIVEKSQDLLNKLGDTVEVHKAYNTQLSSTKNWVNDEVDKLLPCESIQCEKNDLIKKIEKLEAIKSNKPNGVALLTNLIELFEKVTENTSPKGNEALLKELNDLREKFNNIYIDCENYLEKQNETMENWKQFEEQNDDLKKWCKANETIFKELPQKNDLDEKKSLLKYFKENQEIILQKEPQIDEFVDFSNILLSKTGVEKIKIISNQLLNRYKLLTVLSKEVVNRSQNIFNDHQHYEEKFKEADSEISNLEKQLANATENMNLKNMEKEFVQILNIEKDKVESITEDLTSISETVLPETGAAGRERIRDNLRNIRNRFDKLVVDLKNLQKAIDTKSNQWSAFHEIHQQLLRWLEAIENSVHNLESSPATTTQEIRTKILKLKSICQEILSHNRLMETLNEKSVLIQGSPEEKASVENINQRYQAVKQNANNLLENVETIMDVFNSFTEMHKTQLAHQKMLWDKLTIYSDFVGTKSELTSKLEKVTVIQENIILDEAKLNEIESFLEKNSAILPSSIAENITKDFTKMCSEYKKFKNALDKIKKDIEDRLELWQQYQESCEKLTQLLEETEANLKNFALKSSLEEKQESLKSFQVFLSNLQANEGEFDLLSDKASELIQTCGESKTTVFVQQIKSRYSSDENAAKEVVKKCEQMVNDHKLYKDRYNQCFDEYSKAKKELDAFKNYQTISDRKDLENIAARINVIANQHNAMNQLLNTTVEHGENLYPTTDPTGREIIRLEIADLQQKIEELFDNIISMRTKLEFKLSNITGVESLIEKLELWLNQIQPDCTDEIHKRTTLDEKVNQQQAYEMLLNDITAHQNDISILKDLVSSPDTDESIAQKAAGINQRYEDYQGNIKKYCEQYEGIVHDHQQYSVAVMEAQSFIQATQNTADLWGDVDLDRASLNSNLERLKNLNSTIAEEYHRVESVCELGKKVIPNTIASGQINIQQQIDSSKQEWEHLSGTIQSILESIHNKLDQWNDFEILRDSCMDWVRNIESNLHSIDLKPTLVEKKNQFDKLKDLQGEIIAKDLEIDNVTEKAQILLRTLPNSSSKHSVNELVQKYQQISHKIKDLTTRWQQYYIIHQEFDRVVSDYTAWMGDLKSKISYCSDLSGNSQKEMENKFTTIQELILLKEDGSNKLQEILEAAQNVLANTSTPGHEPINNVIAKLHDEWSQCTMKMIDIRSSLGDSINQWSGLSDEIQNIKKSTESIEALLDDLSEYQTSMAEKRTQLELIRNIEERIRVEKVEVDALKARTMEIFLKGKGNPSTKLAQDVLQQFENLFERVKKLLSDREEQFRDHRVYKEAYDNLSNYINRAREKIPMLQQNSLNDKMSIEQSVAPLESLLNKQAQGDLLLEHLQSTSEVVLASTSPNGQQIIKNDIRDLKKSFEDLFKEIRQQKEKLSDTMLRWRDYKDEYEKLSEWLTQMDILVKNHKLALHPTLQDKKKQVADMKEIIDKLERQQEEMDRFNKFCAPLLKSHLESVVGNQLRQLNSRYQVQLNIGKDVVKKVEANYNQHFEFEDFHKRAGNWLNSAKEIIQSCSEGNMTSKDALLSKLSAVQNLIDRREEGQNLVHSTVNSGEKTIKNTKSDGKEVINQQIKQIQSDWDRLSKKMSGAKVNLETQLLQWADYSSSYNQLQQWINEREAKLQQVQEQKAAKIRKGQPGLVERKANLRQTNDIVQDIVSFEPMIQSVTSKASTLQQQSPATEISSKYETLTKQAKELFAKQKDAVEKHQAFLDAGNDFAQWIRNAKEEINKCSESTGDKEVLISKLAQLKALENDIPTGQDKLQKALEQADIAIRNIPTDDREQIEEEVAMLQGEFDNYVDVVKQSKKQLELGITKWSEFDIKQEEAFKWLNEKEGLVQSFNKLQSTLDEKRIALGNFQSLLQTLFDWQRDLDDLNISAQTLLEICADTRISNIVTQLTTKYNTILSMSKEIMKRLEVHYQEHQQHNTLMQELCDDWLDRVREKLNQCQEIPHTIAELEAKLNIVKNIRQSLEQGHNKLRYALELKEKVIVSTESSGVAKIEEDAENVKQEFDKLMTDVNDIRQKLTSRLNLLEEINKQYKVLKEWLVETEAQLQGSDKFYNELGDKKSALEKLRVLRREVQNYNDICEKIKTKLAQENINTTEFNEGLQEFNNLHEMLIKKIENLENQVNDHENYKQSYAETYNWLRATKKDIEECSDPHGEKDLTLNKLAKLRNVEQSIPEGKILMNNAIHLSNNLIPICDSEGQDHIKQELKQMEADWNELENLLKSVTENLEDCIVTWNLFSNKSEEINTILTEFRTRLSAFENVVEIPSEEVIENAKKLSQDIEDYKDVMEELNDMCEILMEKCACSWIRDQTNETQEKYSNLLSQVQGLLSTMNKNIMNQNEYFIYKNEVEKWFDNANQIIEKCNNIQKLDEISSNLNEINILSSRVPEGEKIINLLQESFTKSSNYLPKNKQDEIINEITNIRSEWDTIVVKIGASLYNLKASINRWNALLENKIRLNNWLQEKETILQSVPKGNGESSEMKTSLDRLKYLESEIAQKNLEVDDIVEEMKYFAPLGAPDEDKEKLEIIVQRFNALKQKCASQIADFETEIAEYAAYQHQLQDIEKWLLQISFQLMAHNSLYISNYEQTKEQIAQHESLLEYIQKYQDNIDDLRAKGQQQIERYEPYSNSIKEKIENQIKNIQESYNSLLQTSIQIKNRLYDSLSKFKEYEETLDSIMQNLDSFEKVIDMEMQKPLNTLNEAKMQLQLMNGLQDKLQQEKQRLLLAVQACEAATASISRPSSPVFSQSPAIPEKELLVRAKIDDLVDKLLPCIDALIERVKEFDQVLTKRDELNDWIEQQKIFADDVASKPSKLRSKSAAYDMQAIKDVLEGVNNKRNIIATELSNQLPDEEITDLEQRIDELETTLLKLIEQKRGNQDIIDSYLKSVNDSVAFFDGLINRLEVLDGPCGMNCEQKIQEINSIKNNFETGTAQLKENIQSNGQKVFEVISNLDAQQVDDHMKAFQRRENDMKKRIERKIQLIDLASKNLEKLQSEIDQTKFFFDDNIEKMANPFVLGYIPKPIEGRLQHLKNLFKDIENKQAFIESLNKRISNIHSELDGTEQQKIKQSLADLHKKENKLTNLVKAENARASQGLHNAKALENNLDSIRNWIADQKSYNENKSLIISFAPSAIDYEVQEYKSRLQNIKDFTNGVLNNTYDQIASIKEQCDSNDKNDLQNIVDGFSADIQALDLSYNQQLERIQKILQKKKEYEQESEGLLNWIKETEAAMSSNVKTSSIQILEELMRKFEDFLKEAESKENVLRSIQEKADGLMENLSEVDRLCLTCQVKNLNDKFNFLLLKLKERYNGIVDNIKQLKESQKQIAEYAQFILSIQKAIKDLNKPIGSKTEDVQNLLKEYENILNKLKAKKAEMSLQKISSLPQIKELLSTHDDIIEAIENQLRRLKQLLMLREQFISLINEIVNFNIKYADVVAHVEKSDDKIEEKIKQYDKIMLKIQECEGLFASANDKGMQIASEGTVEDRNNIIEQLQTLKQQLQNLKQNVEKLRQHHEKAANLYKNFEIDITKAINILHEKEAAIKILPILDIDTESVEQELRKHDTLANDIQKHLTKLSEILNGLENKESLPPALAETVSIGRSLMKSLPEAVAEHKKYLDNNKGYRLNYINQVSEFNNWVGSVENEFVNENDDIDFENTGDIIQKHVSCVDDKIPGMKQLLEKINDCAKNILPSLNNINKEELLRDLQKFSATFKDIVARAEQSKLNLQKNHELWQNYYSLLQFVNNLLTKVPKHEPINSIEKLCEFLQKLNDKLNTIQAQQDQIDTLNQLAEKLLHVADQSNREKIQRNNTDINLKWTNTINSIDNQIETLSQISQNWSDFERDFVTIEKSLSILTDKVKDIELGQKSQTLLEDVKNSILQYIDEIKSIEKFKQNLKKLSKPVLEFLKEEQPEFVDPIDLKIEQLGEQIFSLSNILNGKYILVKKLLEFTKDLSTNCAQIDGELQKIEQQLTEFDPYSKEIEQNQQTLDQINNQLSNYRNEIQKLNKSLDEFEEFIAPEIKNHLKDLELKVEKLLDTMDEHNRASKMAKTIRTEYLFNTEKVRCWINDTEEKLKSHYTEPLEYKIYIHNSCQERPSVNEWFDMANKNGHKIIESTQDEREALNIRQNLEQTRDRLNQVFNLLDEQKTIIDNVVDAWSKFMELYQIIINWAAEKKIFIGQELKINNQQEAQIRLNEYSTSLNSIKSITENLSDMNKFLDDISEYRIVDKLKEKLQESENLKIDVEATLIKRNTLLMELTEEWDQYEKKIKDVYNWIKKSRSTIESPQYRNRPLRDQLVYLEKTLADITTQKTKITISFEKLQVHFRTELSCEEYLNDEYRAVIDNLDQFYNDVARQIGDLEKSLKQIDTYQHDIQLLKQKLVQEEQLLKALTPDHPDTAENIQSSRERIKHIQDNIKMRSDRIKAIIKRGTPDADISII